VHVTSDVTTVLRHHAEHFTVRAPYDIWLAIFKPDGGPGRPVSAQRPATDASQQIYTTLEGQPDAAHARPNCIGNTNTEIYDTHDCRG